MKVPQPWYRASKQCWFVTIDGKQYRLGKDEAQAREKYLKLLAKHGGEVGPEENVRKLIDLYWNWAKANLAESTVDRRTPHLQSFWAFIAADLTADKLKPLHIQAWIDKCYSTSGPTYRNIMITTIKGAIAWARNLGYIENDPIACMKKPRCKVRDEFIPLVDWPKVIGSVQSRQRRDFLTFMLCSGVRVQEIRILEARHIEDNRAVFPIAESKGRLKSRVIYMPAEALEIAERLAADWPTGPIFRTNRNKPWTKSSIKSLMTDVRKKLGIKKLSATGLRHSFAHARLTAGQDSAVVATLMGHVDSRMVLTRYGHLSANAEFLAAEANRLAMPQAPVSEEPQAPIPKQPDSDNPQRRSA